MNTFCKSWFRSLSIASLAISSIMAISGDAKAYNKNITGSWQEPDGTHWTILQIGTNCGFSTSLYTEDTGRLSLTFQGFISDAGGDDEFSFSGLMEPKSFKVRGKNCRMTGAMNAGGDVAGEYGGRVIHMNTCSVTIRLTCGDKSDIIPGNCVGTWS